MDISALLKVIIPDSQGRDHESVLDEMAGRILAGAHGHASKVICDLLDHESAEGVLSGTEGAIFHCLSEEVGETVVALAVSRKGVSYRPGKRPVKVFFMIVSPIKESGTHLQLISKIEGLVLDREFQHAVLAPLDAEGIRKEVKRAEGSARSLYIPLGKEDVFSELESAEGGLAPEEAERRLLLTGPNAIRRLKKRTLLKDLFNNIFLNLFAVLLWFGGAMSFIAGMPELGFAIVTVIIINAFFSFWQEYKAERAVEALRQLLPKRVRALRGATEVEIAAERLVPGDVIMLAEGESIPADGRLVAAEELRVDNSALTGESKPVYKTSGPIEDGKGFLWTEVPNLVFAGTAITSGTGTLVVTATGMDTEIGRVAMLTQAIKAEQSPLQKELANLTRTITIIAVFLGIAFFLVGYLLAGLNLAESFIFAIGIIVANVPEGLLPTVSLSLAMAVQRMAGKNAIVKKLSAVETLGSATVICTDKTGTLTSNRMCVSVLYVDGASISVSGDGYAPTGEYRCDGAALTTDELKGMGVHRLLAGAALCNNANLHPPSGPFLPWTITGDPTEGALLTAAEKAGYNAGTLRKYAPRLAHIPFERIRKIMSTVHDAPPPFMDDFLPGSDAPASVLAIVKGAPNVVLGLCKSLRTGSGVHEMTDEERARILAENDRMAARGLRVLAVACRTVPRSGDYRADDVERGLVFVGLIAMLDPPRPEVKKAIAECHGAGIKVVMLTGDYGLTARAIAEDIGLRPSRVITGEELNAIGHAELKVILKAGGAIFARVAPKDKLRVVTALQENGEIVAVTGDGVNDAPALKKADIGVAMGLRGSDVAKESADIILADDNFSSIVDAIREGRAVYANIKKFVTYILTSNIPEIVPVIAYVVFRIPLPLTVIQMLAIDLGSDILPALALGVEPPEKGIMDQPPRPKGNRLLDRHTIIRAYLFLGPMEAALCLGAFFFAYWDRGWVYGTPMTVNGAVYAAATTMTFAGIIVSQIGNVFACRTDRLSVFTVGFFSNRLVLAGIVVGIAFMLILIYTPVISGVFGFQPLTIRDWAFLAVFPAVMLGAAEVRKAYLRRLRKTV